MWTEKVRKLCGQHYFWTAIRKHWCVLQVLPPRAYSGSISLEAPSGMLRNQYSGLMYTHWSIYNRRIYEGWRHRWLTSANEHNLIKIMSFPEVSSFLSLVKTNLRFSCHLPRRMQGAVCSIAFANWPSFLFCHVGLRSQCLRTLVLAPSDSLTSHHCVPLSARDPVLLKQDNSRIFITENYRYKFCIQHLFWDFRKLELKTIVL